MIENHTITVTDLRERAADLISDGYRIAAMFANDERQLSGCFALYVIFYASNSIEVVKVAIDADCPEYPSIANITPGAAWYEREIYDLFGIKPLGHPDLRPLVLHENYQSGVYPLRKDFLAIDEESVCEGDRQYSMAHVSGSGVFEVPVGPIHAGIIEPGHFRFSQAGENIINLDAKLFFTHRGIEKALEGTDIQKAIYQVERVCGTCAVSHALSYSQAIEALAQVEISTRAAYIRVIIAELERLYNHVGDIGNMCAGVGFAVGISNGARLKENLMRLNEFVTGNRFLRGIVIPGGVRLDISADILKGIIRTIDNLEPDFKELCQLLRYNEAFLDRAVTTGVLPRKAAVDLAVVGVAARASGISYDTRRDNSYGIYDRLKFKIPVYTTGDVAARLWVRADEALQSIDIIRQLIDSLPTNDKPLSVNIPAIMPYSSAVGWSESARGANFHWLMAGENNVIYRYHVRSASYANWPALAIAAPGNIIPDFPLINKSFELCYACIDR